MRLDSNQNRASNSQLGENRKTNKGGRKYFTNTKLGCKTKEIIRKFRDKHSAWSSFESLLKLPRKSTFTNVSLQTHQYFAPLYCLTYTRAGENRAHSTGPAWKPAMVQWDDACRQQIWALCLRAVQWQREGAKHHVPGPSFAPKARFWFLLLDSSIPSNCLRPPPKNKRDHCQSWS